MKKIIFIALVVCIIITSCDIGNGDDAHIHSWGEWQDSTVATCTEAAKQIRICSDDLSHIETRNKPESVALGHDFDDIYISNGDGTESTICQREGCNVTNTRNEGYINTENKTIVVENIPSELLYITGYWIHICEIDSEIENSIAQGWYGLDSIYIDDGYNVTITVPIYETINYDNDIRWTGSGVFDIYLDCYLDSSSDGSKYRKFSNIVINETIINLNFNDASIFIKEGSGDIGVDIPPDKANFTITGLESYIFESHSYGEIWIIDNLNFDDSDKIAWSYNTIKGGKLEMFNSNCPTNGEYWILLRLMNENHWEDFYLFTNGQNLKGPLTDTPKYQFNESDNVIDFAKFKLLSADGHNVRSGHVFTISNIVGKMGNAYIGFHKGMENQFIAAGHGKIFDGTLFVFMWSSGEPWFGNDNFIITLQIDGIDGEYGGSYILEGQTWEGSESSFYNISGDYTNMDFNQFVNM